jgi:hypothetical protein
MQSEVETAEKLFKIQTINSSQGMTRKQEEKGV